MKKRLTVIPHNLTFDPDRSEQENYRESDDNLKVNFENINYICAFIKILTEYFIKYFSKTKLLRDIPLKVIQYTKAYAEENDLVATWLKENYVILNKTDPEYKNSKINTTIMYDHYKLIMKDNDMSQTRFGRKMTSLKIEKIKSGREYYIGLKELKDE